MKNLPKEKQRSLVVAEVQNALKKYSAIPRTTHAPSKPNQTENLTLTRQSRAAKNEAGGAGESKVITKESAYLNYLKTYPWKEGGHPLIRYISKGGKAFVNNNYLEYKPDFLDKENQEAWAARELILVGELDLALTGFTDLFEYIELRRTVWNSQKQYLDLLEGQGARPLASINHHPADPFHYVRKIPQRVFYSLVSIIIHLKLGSTENVKIIAALKGDLGNFFKALKYEPILLKTSLGMEILKSMPFYEIENLNALGRALKKTAPLEPRNEPADVLRAYLLALYYEVPDIDLLQDQELISLIEKFDLGISYDKHDEIFCKYRNQVRRLRVRDVFRKNLVL